MKIKLKAKTKSGLNYKPVYIKFKNSEEELVIYSFKEKYGKTGFDVEIEEIHLPLPSSNKTISNPQEIVPFIENSNSVIVGIWTKELLNEEESKILAQDEFDIRKGLIEWKDGINIYKKKEFDFNIVVAF